MAGLTRPNIGWKMKSDAVKFVDRMIRLFSKPKSWTRYAYARVAPGKEHTRPSSTDANCFCLEGAVMRCRPGISHAHTLDVQRAMQEESESRGAHSYIDWNDDYCKSRTQAVAFLKAVKKRVSA
jgi:hypothetical protein